MPKTRKNITDETVAQVIFKSNRLCCCCGGNRRADQIHHIDGDILNNTFENLVYLCFDCHHDAEVKGGLKRKLTPKAIIKYRDLHYTQIDVQRKNSLKNVSTPIRQLSSEDLIIAAKSAIIIIEIDKIKHEYFDTTKTNKGDTLAKLLVFTNHATPRITYELFNVLLDIADDTYVDSSISIQFLQLIQSYFPSSEVKSNSKQSLELADIVINICFSLIYDSFINTSNFEAAHHGLLILKYLYRYSKENKLSKLPKSIKDVYQELEDTLERPERIDLETAKLLLKTYKNDLETNDLRAPIYTQKLSELLAREKNS